MGPKKRKSKNLEEQPPASSTAEPPKRSRRSNVVDEGSSTSQSKETTKAAASKAKKIEKIQSKDCPVKPKTKTLRSKVEKKILETKNVEEDIVTVQNEEKRKSTTSKNNKIVKQTKDTKTNTQKTKVEKKKSDSTLDKKSTSKSKETQKATTSKYFQNIEPQVNTSEPKTKDVLREVTIDTSLNVDKVKKMIQDKEDKMSRASKRIKALNAADLAESTPTDNSKSETEDPQSKENMFPNVTKFILRRQVIGDEYKSSREIQNWCVSKNLTNFKLLHRNSFVQARISTLVWNKARPQQVAFSDKHGHIVVGEIKQKDHSVNWKLLLQKNGVGPGGNVLAMKFSKSMRDGYYSLWYTGLEGTVVRMDCAQNEEILSVVPGDTAGGNIFFSEYIPTNDYDHWYTAMDLTPNEALVGVGCSKGFLTLITQNGEIVDKYRASKTKITHVEFCPKNPEMFVTTSLDKTVKLWDQRFLERNKFVTEFKHHTALNSAYFNEKCDMLLVTDQFDEILTYDPTTLRLLTKIKHPHRQFQHLTPIKATWHPQADIIVAGRYPKDERDRCVDLFLSNGHRLGTLDSTSHKIQSVVRCSPDGKYLLSSFGSGLEVWGTKPDHV